MSRPTRVREIAAAALAVAAALAACSAAAQDRQVYRYTDPDGRVVYSDRPPPNEAKAVQQKRLGGNYIETSEPSYATRAATENFPVTLYTFACGDPCQSGEALLNARGVPFSKVNVQEPAGAQRLKDLTGELTGPVLQVGDKLIAKGYNESKWQALLDEAGYPKAVPRRTTGKAVEPPPAARADASASAASGGTGVTTLPEPRTPYPQ
jgi:hypothetical protein